MIDKILSDLKEEQNGVDFSVLFTTSFLLYLPFALINTENYPVLLWYISFFVGVCIFARSGFAFFNLFTLKKEHKYIFSKLDNFEDHDRVSVEVAWFIFSFAYIFNSLMNNKTVPDNFELFTDLLVSILLTSVLYLLYLIFFGVLVSNHIDSLEISRVTDNTHNVGYNDDMEDDPKQNIEFVENEHINYDNLPNIQLTPYVKIHDLIVETNNELLILNERLSEFNLESVHHLISSIKYLNHALSSFDVLHPKEQVEMERHLISSIEKINNQINDAWVYIHSHHKENIIKMNHLISLQK